MKVYRNPDILWREEDESEKKAFDALEGGEDASGIGTSVLFSDGIMLSLNILGTEIWKRCDGRSVEEIAADLVLSYNVAPEDLKQDILNFLAELRDKGFVRYEK